MIENYRKKLILIFKYYTYLLLEYVQYILTLMLEKH